MPIMGGSPWGAPSVPSMMGNQNDIGDMLVRYKMLEYQQQLQREQMQMERERLAMQQALIQPQVAELGARTNLFGAQTEGAKAATAAQGRTAARSGDIDMATQLYHALNAPGLTAEQQQPVLGQTVQMLRGANLLGGGATEIPRNSLGALLASIIQARTAGMTAEHTPAQLLPSPMRPGEAPVNPVTQQMGTQVPTPPMQKTFAGTPDYVYNQLTGEVVERGLHSYAPQEQPTGSFLNFAGKVMESPYFVPPEIQEKVQKVLGPLLDTWFGPNAGVAAPAGKKRVAVVGPGGQTGTIVEGDTLPPGWKLK